MIYLITYFEALSTDIIRDGRGCTIGHSKQP